MNSSKSPNFTVFRKHSTEFFRGAVSVMNDLSPKAAMLMGEILDDLASIELGLEEAAHQIGILEIGAKIADRAVKHDFMSNAWAGRGDEECLARTKMAERVAGDNREWLKSRPMLWASLGLKTNENGVLVGDSSWVDPDKEP